MWDNAVYTTAKSTNNMSMRLHSLLPPLLLIVLSTALLLMIFKDQSLNTDVEPVHGRATMSVASAIPDRAIDRYLQFLRHVHPSRWINIITVRSGQDFEVNNALCYYQKIQLQHVIFLTDDVDIDQYLQSRGQPVVYVGRTIESERTPNILSEHSLREHDFLHAILLLDYSFVLLNVATLLLANPVHVIISEDEVDVRMKQMMDQSWSNAMYTVSSSAQGRYYWEQVKACRLQNLQRSRDNWIDCVIAQFVRTNGTVRTGALDTLHFPDVNSALIDRYPQMNGIYPVAIIADAITENARPTYNSFGLIAVAQKSNTTCKYETPPTTLKPPTDEVEVDFTLKIRLFGWVYMSRILKSLAEADYDGDKHIDLEIYINYPKDMSSSYAVVDWKESLNESRSFVWKHGRYTVIKDAEFKGLHTARIRLEPIGAKEILLVLESDVVLSKRYYIWLKKMIQTYYLNPDNYNPNLFGISMQLPSAILGETTKHRYSSRQVKDILDNSTHLYRYQFVSSGSAIFFPQHWNEFLVWLQSKQYNLTTGESAVGFQPCVPSLIHNQWLHKKINWQPWFFRFIYEKGWYSLNINIAKNKYLIAFDLYSNTGSNYGPGFVRPTALENLTSEKMMSTPRLESVPLYDFHFERVADPFILTVRNSIMAAGDNFTDCWTITNYANTLKKCAAAAERAPKVEDERRTVLRASYSKASAKSDIIGPEDAATTHFGEDRKLLKERSRVTSDNSNGRDRPVVFYYVEK